MAAITLDRPPTAYHRSPRRPPEARLGAQSSLRRPPDRPSPAVAARRLRLAGVTVLLVAACAVWTQTGATGGTGNGPLAVPGAGPTSPAAVQVWVVQPGDTLWGIARQVQPSGDIRPLVDALNGEVRGRPLQVGQQLTLP